MFKSFYDETTSKTANWYFYYDSSDRLTEVRYTPDSSISSTYSVFQLFWLGGHSTLYWQIDYPSVTTSKRYTSTDETGRIYELVRRRETQRSIGELTPAPGVKIRSLILVLARSSSRYCSQDSTRMRKKLRMRMTAQQFTESA